MYSGVLHAVAVGQDACSSRRRSYSAAAHSRTCGLTNLPSVALKNESSRVPSAGNRNRTDGLGSGGGPAWVSEPRHHPAHRRTVGPPAYPARTRTPARSSQTCPGPSPAAPRGSQPPRTPPRAPRSRARRRALTSGSPSAWRCPPKPGDGHGPGPRRGDHPPPHARGQMPAASSRSKHALGERTFSKRYFSSLDTPECGVRSPTMLSAKSCKRAGGAGSCAPRGEPGAQRTPRVAPADRAASHGVRARSPS